MNALLASDPRRAWWSRTLARAQLTSEYTEADGIRLPTRRRAHVRGPDGRPVANMLMVHIDISDVSFK
jgi:hypothetical protein